MFDAFGPKPEMQVYGRGLRRRLPPMLDGDPHRIRMVYSLLFALPGTPVLFYGEEIGMGENLALEGRFAVRTPMQWTPDAGGGFSTADPATFPGPLTGGRVGPKQVNVRDQERDPELAAVLDPAAGRVLPGLPGAGLGRLHRARPRPGRAAGAGAPLRLPTGGRCWRCTTSPTRTWRPR